MSVLVLGVNHRSAPIEVLERLALDDASAAKLVHGLITSDVVREAVVLSTCNRTEVYAVAERFHGAHGALHDTLCDVSGLDRAELDGHLYSFHDDAAVEHACAVAAGLESLVVGESEILGQVRHAVDVARAESAVRSTLELLFRRAIAAGKRARTETGIARGTASISHAAVELAADHLGGLSGCRVAVVGAGTMGEQIAVALADADVDSITVVNRSRHRADSLAARIGGSASGLDGLIDALADADVVLTCTGAPSTLIDRAMVSAAGQRQRLFIDVSVPRDIANDVADDDASTVIDLGDLDRWAAVGRDRRLGEVDAVRAIVAEEADRFSRERIAMQATPLITSLRRRVEDVRDAEWERHAARLADFDEAQLDAVRSLVNGVVNKVLHEPSVRLRADAGTPRGERNAAAVADLFDLE
jgi:glutamyl-tRNA reductase